MNADPLTCPYCNARQTDLSGVRLGQRLSCARCGESFTVTRLPEQLQLPAQTGETGEGGTSGWSKPIRANRVVAGIVLGMMMIMAGTGLTYALLTVQTRREHDKAIPRKPRRPWLVDRTVEPADEPIAPGDLPALGYLPPSTGLVACIHLEELFASPTGKDVEARMLKVADGAFQLGQIKEWTGLALEEIEHIVLGVVVRIGQEADLTPPTHLVVRTRKAYSSSRVRVALKASKAREQKTPEGGKRTIYSGSVRMLPVQIWLADERTVILGLFSDLEQIPGKPREGLNQLPVELRQVMEKRLSPGVPAWVAGHSANWKKTWLPTLLSAFKENPLWSNLEQVNTFAVWLMPGNPAKVFGVFRCAEESVAKRIEQTDLRSRQKEFPDTFKFHRAGDWLELQLSLPAGQGK